MYRLPTDAQYRALTDAILLGNRKRLVALVEQYKIWLGYHGGGKGTLLSHLLSNLPERGAMLADLVRCGMSVVGATVDQETQSLVKDALASQPLWRRQAHEMGIVEITLVREKAWGLAFIPGDGQCPFRYGGDYEGARHATAQDAFDELMRDLASSHRVLAKRARWFQPHLQRLVNTGELDLRPILEAVSSDPHAVRLTR